MATQTTSVEPFNRIDELTAQLGALQLRIIGLLAAAGTEHQAIDARFAPELNPLYQEAQATFDELERLAATHRGSMLRSDKKSAKRNTGTVGWRTTPRLVLQATEDVLIERIRGMGQSTGRRLVRRVVRRELNRDALLSTANRELVAQIEGLEVTRDEDFFVLPSGGVRMSSAHPLWPFLEGVTGQVALNRVVVEADA